MADVQKFDFWCYIWSYFYCWPIAKTEKNVLYNLIRLPLVWWLCLHWIRRPTNKSINQNWLRRWYTLIIMCKVSFIWFSSFLVSLRTKYVADKCIIWNIYFLIHVHHVCYFVIPSNSVDLIDKLLSVYIAKYIP